MPSNLTSTPIATDLELEAQKQQLLADISYLGGKLNEYELQSTQIINRESELLDLKDLITEANKNLDSVHQQLTEKKAELNEVVSQVGALHGKKLELNRELGSLEIERDQSKKTLSSADQELNVEMTKKKAVIEQLNEALTNKNGELSITNRQLTTTQAQIERAMENLASVEHKVEEANQLYTDKFQTLQQAEGEITAQQVESQTLKSELAELEKQKIQAQKDSDEIIRIANLYKKDTIEQLEKQQNNMDQVAGDLSVRESWLNEKEELLKNTKAELEKFYNRKITHINF